MSLPDPLTWTTHPDVLEHVGGVGPGDADEYVRAALATTAELRPDLDLTDVTKVAPNHVLAVAILAKRLYNRRSSALGVATFGEFGPIYVARADTDYARLIGIGPYSVPQL